MNWIWQRFAELGFDNLHDALQLRCRVFILDQGPYLDVDGLDREPWHLLGRDHANTLLAYLRVVDPGVKYAEPSIGRVITAPEVRGSGLGRMLMREGLAGCAVRWPGQAPYEGGFHDLFPSWDEFWKSPHPAGTTECDVAAPVPLGQFLTTLSRGRDSLSVRVR